MKSIDDPEVPDRPLMLKGEVVHEIYATIRNLRWAMFGALALAVLGVAVMLALFQRDQHRIAGLERRNAQVVYDACRDRNARAAASTAALGKLVAASKADRDGNQARAWQAFVDQTRATSLPACVKPDD